MEVAGAGQESPLAGGNMGTVTRLGNEIRRPAGPWTANVHRLLRRYEEAGIDETPRPLGFTADGRERLSFLPGSAANDPAPPWLWQPGLLVEAARLLRRLHDASVPLAGITSGWRSPVREPAEVVCHNDFAPYNLVFGGVGPEGAVGSSHREPTGSTDLNQPRLAGVIDFDYCSPGPRIWDVAYLGYRLAPLTAWSSPGMPASEVERAERLELLLSAYGLEATAADLLAVVVTRLLALADFSDRAAAELANPELAEHASGYRADATRLASGRLAPSD